jgi:Fur family transcriptional regulator, ferric uptake regulator
MEKNYKKFLRQNNFKVTPKRKAIVDYFIRNKIYSTPEEIWETLKKSFLHLGLPTIYRNLEILRKVGLLTRVYGEENRLYYGLCEAEDSASHHHHIVCVKCHKVGLVEDCSFDKLVETVEKKSGFKVIDHNLQLRGICDKCRSSHQN